jgi:hypothetical protein
MYRYSKVKTLVCSFLILFTLVACEDEEICLKTFTARPGQIVTFVDGGRTYSTTIPDSGKISIPCSASVITVDS